MGRELFSLILLEIQKLILRCLLNYQKCRSRLMKNGLCKHKEMLFLLIKNIKVDKNIFLENKSQQKQVRKH